MGDRALLIIKRINERYHAIASIVPPLQPEPCRWLYSDATESYCKEHAIEARGREFDMGVPFITDQWRTTPIEEAFYDGIGRHWDGESDTTEQCTTCGKTLSYILTDWGVERELAYWLDEPVAKLDPETVYALDRLCLNVWAGRKRRTLLETAVVIGQAYRLLPTPTKGTPHDEE